MSEGGEGYRPQGDKKVSRRTLIKGLLGAFGLGVAAKTGIDRLASSNIPQEARKSIENIDERDISAMTTEAGKAATEFQATRARTNSSSNNSQQ